MRAHRRFFTGTVIAFACAGAFTASVARAASTAALFEENFLNTTGKNRNIDVASYEWASFAGPKGEAKRSDTSIGPGPGNPADTNGFLAVSNGPLTTRALIKNVKPALDLNGATVSFRFGASHVQTQVRIVIRAAGQWYASDTVFTPASPLPNATAFSSAAEAAVLKKLPFKPSAVSWRALKFEPGEEMSLTDKPLAAPLASTSITAIGFLLVNTHATWGVSTFFDSLRITPPAR